MKKKEWEKLQQLTVEELVARENELRQNCSISASSMQRVSSLTPCA